MLQQRASAHAMVSVADMTRAKAFYTDVLALDRYEDRGSAIRYEMGDKRGCPPRRVTGLPTSGGG